MKTSFILGFIAIIVNIFLVLYLKKRGKNTKNDKLPVQFKHRIKGSKENIPENEILSLLEHSSSELGLPAEELLKMSTIQIKQLAMEKLQNTKIEIYQQNIAAINKIPKDRQRKEREDSEE